jgi:hypothetical protein
MATDLSRHVTNVPSDSDPQLPFSPPDFVTDMSCVGKSRIIISTSLLESASIDRRTSISTCGDRMWVRYARSRRKRRVAPNL